MVTDQLSLLDISATPNPAAPRCRLCTRPARWLRNKAQWGMYCNGYNCNNRERQCQTCNQPFIMGADGAGNKYCSTDCKLAGYHPRSPETALPHCAWCGARAADHTRPNAWPYICRPCLDPIKYVLHILKAHHVSADMARRLVGDPTCEICGTNILVKKRERSHGQPKVLLVVDHDHDCCPVSTNSCGRCVRGLICRDCNIAAGLLADEPKRARALGDYLESWVNR